MAANGAARIDAVVDVDVEARRVRQDFLDRSAVGELAGLAVGQAVAGLADGEAGKFPNGGSVQEILSNPTGLDRKSVV